MPSAHHEPPGHDLPPEIPETRARADGNGPARGPFGTRVYPLGRVFGIQVGVDLSWLLIFALVVGSLGPQLVAEHRNWGAPMAWGVAVVASLLLFGSILLHELGHSLVAIGLGLPVRSITLFLFGGVAQMTREPRRAGDAVLIAVAGPAVSFLLALGSFVLWLITNEIGGWGQVVAALAGRLAAINLMLAVFNSLPGLPLDGGHVLRAAVWAVTGSAAKGTRVASAAGSAFAMLFMVLGVWISIRTRSLNGWWMVLIGWFMLRVSRATDLQMVLKQRLGRMRVAQAMEQKITIDLWSTVADVQELLSEARRPAFVVDGNQLVGWVTPERVRAVPEKKRAFTRVSSILDPIDRVPGIQSDRSALDALMQMSEKGRQELAVFDGEELAGALTRERLIELLRAPQVGGRGGEAPARG